MVVNGKSPNYIVQRINSKLITNVEKLMNNIRLATEFNRQKITARGGNLDRESLSLVYTNDGKVYYHCPGSDGYFRVYIFITDAIAYQVVEKPEHFYRSAVAFGNFANLLAEFDATQLYEVLPRFHDTEKRFGDFEASLKADKINRAKDLSKVNFRLDLFEEYEKGYLGAVGKGATQIERDNLAFGAILMTYECGMRFLADYLDGEVYFRTHKEGQNLDRSRTQFKLIEDMEKCF